MIRELCGEELAAAEGVLQRPATGDMLGVALRLKLANPLMPYRFYKVGGAALLECSGTVAALCGAPEDGGELCSFLALHGVQGLYSEGWTPPGWTAERNLVMRLARMPKGSRLPGGAKLELCPAAGDVVDLLAEEGLAGPERERLYFELCAKRNHGLALVAGLRVGGRLAATAGFWALLPGRAYIACVHTAEAERGKGLASGLLAALCRQSEGRETLLMCRPALCQFYKKLGFETMEGEGAVFATAPQG